MIIKVIFFMAVTSATVMAEQPTNTFGPYSASGWRPSKPFNFPRENFQPTPPEISNQRQGIPPQSQADFEVTKARVDFVGQIQDNVFIPNSRQPHKEYLAPNAPSPNFIKVQDLPLQTIFQKYNPSAKQQQQNFAQPNSQQQFFPRPSYKPNEDSPASHIPAAQYGPPQKLDFNIIYPDPEPRNFESTANGGDVADYAPDDTDKGNEYVRAKQGQYFVLAPDNTIQRVVFTTTQDEEEKRTNGFTAQLKYTPVGELRDPVFKYNNRGQLVRVLKKK